MTQSSPSISRFYLCSFSLCGEYGRNNFYLYYNNNKNKNTFTYSQFSSSPYRESFYFFIGIIFLLVCFFFFILSILFFFFSSSLVIITWSLCYPPADCRGMHTTLSDDSYATLSILLKKKHTVTGCCLSSYSAWALEKVIQYTYKN